MAFLGSLLEYVVKMIVLAIVAVAGIFLGKFLRKIKDAKNSEASIETNE